jgi:hypothetical protein
MVEKHVFGPIPLDVSPTFSRADLEVYRIDHFRPSFVAQVFFNDPEVDETTASEDRPGYAGRFTIFGHQECSGDEGHCEVHEHKRRFDERPTSPLTRAFKRVVVTDALRRVLGEGPDEGGARELTVTMIVTTDPGDEHEGQLLDIEGLQLSAFD